MLGDPTLPPLLPQCPLMTGPRLGPHPTRPISITIGMVTMDHLLLEMSEVEVEVVVEAKAEAG